MATQEKVDVVIVGAGASGSTFAAVLAKAGRKVLVMDNGPDWQTYDAVGDLTSQTDANGHTTTYTYDTLDRVIIVTDALGKTTVTVYDGEGDKVQVIGMTQDAPGSAEHHRPMLVDDLVPVAHRLWLSSGLATPSIT